MAIWKIDKSHSEIKFKVKHLVISTVTGQFKEFDATVESEKSDFSDAKISFWADVNSIDTRNEKRDSHLKSADFFDAANYPRITFESRSINKKSENEYEVVGDISIRGVTKEIKLNVTYNGTVKGFGGVEVAGFEITGKLNRFDFGLKWNALTEAGGIVVGDEVKIEISCELTKAN
ncbi:MAG: YceI family protein [Ignavibacterium sp.]